MWERRGSWDGRGAWWWRLSRFPLGACFVDGWFVGLLCKRPKETIRVADGGGEDGEEVGGKRGILKLTTA
jgi:hypothetical protein